jgi:hypothetical protein
MRRCVHCGASRPKEELMRIVRTPGGEIALDQTQRRAGRGAYVCREPACADGFLRSKRSGLLGVALPAEVADSLREACRRSAF